jgi:transglutaminase-like putative cysteine protease
MPPLKWRGAALTEFDGRRWSNADPAEQRIPVLNGHAKLGPPRDGKRLNYHVQLNAGETDALFFAGTPVTLDLRQFIVLRDATGSYRLPRVPAPGFGYDAYSVLDGPPELSTRLAPAEELAPEMRRQALQLPQIDGRITALARELTGPPSRNDLERARALERRLRRDYTYSLELPNHEVADPLVDFLFTRRKGYCEHFASAMTIMLRTLGIPARLVTGFQGGVYNPLSELWVIRASDAHSWVEAWIPEFGWTTFDPTPPDPNPGSFALLSRIELYVDAAQTFWQDWVVSYDLRRQGTLSYRMELGAHRLGILWFDSLAGWGTLRPLRSLAAWRGPALGAFSLLLFAGCVWLMAPRLARLARLWNGVRRVRRGSAAVGDATLLYKRMLQVLRHRGYQKPAWFTPSEFAASLPSNDLGTAVGEFTSVYNEWRFGGRAELAVRLSELLDRLDGESS